MILGCETATEWQKAFTDAGVRLVLSSGGSSEHGVLHWSVERLVKGFQDGNTLGELLALLNEGVNRRNQAARSQGMMKPFKATMRDGTTLHSTGQQILGVDEK